MAFAGWIVAILAILVAVAVVIWMYGRVRAGRSEHFATSGQRRPADNQVAKSAFGALPVPSIVVDGESRVLAISTAAEAKFPFLKAGSDLLSAFGELELVRRASEVARTGTIQRFDVRLFIDQRRTFNVRIAPVVDDAVVICFADRTAAADYTELRLQFVANVSHELRTPLTGLGGLLEALADDDLDDEHRIRFAKKAQHEVGRLGALMDDVMLLSELETSSAPLADEPIDLAEAASQAVGAQQQAASVARVDLRTDAQPGLLVAMTPRIAGMVVANLVANAIRYAGAGSVATIRVYEDGGDAVLEVADDGIGIGEEHLPHIFERFYRADRSRSNQVGGTGLGLAIVKHIAERMGGVASAASRPGFGTTMTVRLPLAPAAAATRPPDQESLADQVGEPLN